MSLLNKVDYAYVPDPILWEYAGMDVDATYRVFQELRRRLRRSGLQDYYWEHIIPTLRNLLRTSLRGIYVNRKRLEKLDRFLTKVTDSLERQMRKVAGKVVEDFNPRSSAHVGKVLYGYLDLPVIKKTPSGNPSTDKDTLEQLFEQTREPFLDLLLQFRSLEKARSTYVAPLYVLMDENDRVHPTYKIEGAITGRITAETPAVTTIPRDREYRVGDRSVELSFRGIFCAPPGYRIAYMDIQQGELRVAAIVSGDQALLDILESGGDLHEETARECLGIEGEISKEQRVLSKAINFGLLYGASPHGLSNSTGAPLEVVEDFMRKHRRRFPALHRFIEHIPDVAMETGYLESPFGRRKHIPPVLPRDAGSLAALRRELINFLPQNGCMEVMARVYNRLCDRFKKNKKLEAFPVNLVYDSVLVEFKKGYEKEVKEIMLEEQLKPVPELDNHVFACSWGVGRSWSEAEKNAEDYR